MFSFGKKESSKKLTGSQPPDALKTWLSSVVVHTIPDKFLPRGGTIPAHTSGGVRSRLLWVWIAVGILIIGMVGAAIYVFLAAGNEPGPATGSIDEILVERPVVDTPGGIDFPPDAGSGSDIQPEYVGDIPAGSLGSSEQENEPAEAGPPIADESETDEGDVGDGSGEDLPDEAPEPDESQPVGELTDEADPTPVPPVRTRGIDRDGDGLTDREEEAFGTNNVVADTDNDGYSDASEVIHLFNPLQGGGALLRGSSVVREYVNAGQGYAVVFPAGWSVAALDFDEADVIYRSSEAGEYFEVKILPNRFGSTDPVSWWRSEYPASRELYNEITVGNLKGVSIGEGRQAFLLLGDRVAAVSYEWGTATTIEFDTAFEVFINSFQSFTPQSVLNS